MSCLVCELTRSSYPHPHLLSAQAANDADVRSKLGEKGDDYFDFIILDEHLGDESMLGSELTKQLRQEGCRAVIIACSGNCLPNDVARYQVAGANSAWPKPYPSTAQMRNDLVRAISASSKR